MLCLQDLPEAAAHIEFDDATATFKCTTCIKAGVNNTFTGEGSTRIQTQAVREHLYPKGDGRNSHTHACQLVAGKEGLQKSITKQQVKVQGAHIPLARTVLFMCVSLLPLSLLGGLVGLQATNGSEPLAHLGGSYCNPHVATEYAGIFSSMLDDAVVQQLQQSPWFSVLIDESTDVSVEKHLSVFVRYIGANMQPVETFLQLEKVSDGDAASLHSLLLEVLQDRGLDMSKMVGFGSDGASVMTGDKKGVGVRLKHDNPFITTMHCIAHRAALAAQDVFSEVEYAKWFDSLLTRVHSYFSRSGPRLQALAAVQKALNTNEVRIPTVHAVRWLSRDHVVSAVANSLGALIKVFADDAAGGNVVAAGLARDMGLARHFVMVYFFQDVVSKAAKLSKQFQGDTFSFVKISDTVNGFMAMLQQRYIADGAPLCEGVKQAMDNVRALHHGAQQLDIDPNDAAGLVLRDLTDIFDDCKAAMRDIAARYVAAIKHRFPSLSLLENFDIFNPNNLHSAAGTPAADTYGDAELGVLADFYGTAKVVDGVTHAPMLDAQLLRDEWPQARLMLLRKASRLVIVSGMKAFLNFHAEVLRDLTDSCPVACALIMIMLCIPAHTAEVERGFSIQNLIKSKFRSRLKVDNLDILMRVKMLGPNTADDEALANSAVDLEAAAAKWQSLKKRNPLKSNAGVARVSRKPKHRFTEDFSFEELGRADSV